MQLRSGIAEAVAWACGSSFNLTPSLGTSICRGCGSKKTKRKEKSYMSAKIYLGNLGNLDPSEREHIIPLLLAKIFFFFWLFRAIPTAYGGSQARGQI